MPLRVYLTLVGKRYSDGLLYVKTLGNEIEIHADDLVIWLSKIEGSSQN
ncbi:hypothetical protein KBT16_04915 [Nostoc sp. CCCryo 231-06]|nr:hypothetical protein [Nostoc sp. CCCryo 231-06]